MSHMDTSGYVVTVPWFLACGLWLLAWAWGELSWWFMCRWGFRLLELLADEERFLAAIANMAFLLGEARGLYRSALETKP